MKRFRRTHGSFSSSEYLCDNDELQMELQESCSENFSSEDNKNDDKNETENKLLNHKKRRSYNSVDTEIHLNPSSLSQSHSSIALLLNEGYISDMIRPENEEIDSLMHNNNATIGKDSSIKFVSQNRAKVAIDRDAIDWDDLNLKYGKKSLKRISLNEKCVNELRKFGNDCSVLQWIISLFPFFTWIRSYPIKDNLVSDLIAGFTIAILHIPQGMAYSLLAGLRPENGLYLSFFPVLIYVLMGTSRHISIGSFAVVSIMLSNTLSKVNTISYDTDDTDNNITQIALNGTNNEDLPTPLEVLTCVCFVSGIFQLIIGLLHLGALSVILSDTLVSGFSTGCAITVATSQLEHLFDIKLRHIDNGPLKLVHTWINICENLKHTNLVTLGISICAIIVLSIVKEIVEPWFKKKFSTLKLPIPIDIIIVIGATFLSWIIGFHNKYEVDIMKEIPTGLPSPKLPRLSLFPEIITDSIVISIVAFAVSLSLAKIFAKRHKYTVNANQELNAMGTANIFASFFGCYPCAASLSRSSVQDKMGKTQIASIVSSAIILIVLLFLAPLLYHLPKVIHHSTPLRGTVVNISAQL